MSLVPLPKRQPGSDDVEMERLRSDVANKAYVLCKEYLEGPWAQLHREDFEITPLGGGLTNKLYICTLPLHYRENDNECDGYPHTVLLRIYGLILQDFKAQIQESVVFSILAERGVGPKLYAVFPGGRLEEYLPCRTLTTSDLSIPVYSRNIAKRVSEYHRLEMPVKKEPSFITGKLFNYLEKWKTACFKDTYNHSLLEEFNRLDIHEEVDYIKTMLIQRDSVVVFCHNDVQEGNILHSDDGEGNPIHLIDFEYSSYNYRDFDIGNHFCEWMFDYSHQKWPFFSYRQEDFPDKEQQLNFVDSYLQSMYDVIPSRKNDPRWSVEFVLQEADRMVLFSHLFWALWSVRQAQISDIAFGYMDYAMARMNAYFRHKKRFD